jgi:uncharacterized protein with von Willebrand factor type A (vWA) domain
VFAVLLFELAAAVNAFGALVRAEVEESTAAEEAAAVAALDTLREAGCGHRMTFGGRPRRHGHLGTERSDTEAVERVLRELDVEGQARRRATRRPDRHDPRSMLRSAQEHFNETARQLGEQPLRRYPD